MSVDRFKNLFQGRENVWGQYFTDRKPITSRVAIPDEAWENHLQGREPFLGVVPIRLDNKCLFGAIDLDDDDTDHELLEKQVMAHSLPLVVCRSKSGGAHLYLFCSEPIEAKALTDHLRKFMKALGLSSNNDGRAIEIFPKQTKIAPDITGNWINLPYFGGDNTNRYALKGGQKLSLAQFLDYAESLKRSLLQLNAWRDTAAGPFEDGPPCLGKLHQIGIGEGERNGSLYNIGVMFKLKYPSDWAEQLRAYNDSYVRPPVSQAEIDNIIRSLERHDYKYTCDKAPIAQHCQKKACKQQLYGIGVWRRQQIEADFPEVDHLVMIQTDPPRWLLNVNGHTIELSTDDLMLQPRFKKVCFERLNLVVPTIRPTEWDTKLKELQEKHTKLEAPDDAGTKGQFIQLVREFVGRRDKVHGRPELLRGLPIEENDKIYFRSADLEAFLVKRNFRAFGTHEIYSNLRGIGVGHSQFNIQGACVKVWYIPILGGEQTEPFEVKSATTAKPSF